MLKMKDIKTKEGSLRKLSNLLNDDSKKVYGVFYTNTFFSQRYLTRAHVLTEDINIEDNTIELVVASRLEQLGLTEVEMTLEMLVEYGAGDMPGFSPDYVYADVEEEDIVSIDKPTVPELVSAGQSLFTVDIMLKMKDPTITYKDFTIAGEKFTLVNIDHKLDKEDDLLDQSVLLLFGDVGKLYLMSHFYDKELTVRDTKMILDLIVDENLTGKAITGIRVETSSGVSSNLFPIESLIGSYRNYDGDIIFNTNTGYIKIPEESLKDYKLICEPNTVAGDYRLILKGKDNTVTLYLE